MLNICKPVPINMIRLLSAFIKIVHRCRSSILSDPTGRVSINAINPNRTQQRHQTPHASNNYIIHINKNIILYTLARANWIKRPPIVIAQWNDTQPAGLKILYAKPTRGVLNASAVLGDPRLSPVRAKRFLFGAAA